MENKTKLGIIGVISFPFLLFAIFLTGIFLGGDISWATNHVGVNFFINDGIDLFLIASVFTVSVIVVTDDWLSDNKYKGNGLRLGSSLATWGGLYLRSDFFIPSFGEGFEKSLHRSIKILDDS